ncbi:MAG: hypothetical protein KAV00_12860, partial [Phycisphaerae bacterium]|nr:hypothetical protein [Phycisphaerae bacterium]
GKIEVLNLKEELVRVTYDFSRRKQLSDWRARNGTWTVSGKKEAIIATPAEDNWTCLTSRLRFRADKPLTFTFRARGRESLAGMLAFQWKNDPQRRRHWLYCKLGGSNYYSSNCVSYLRDGDQRVWSDRRFKVARNTTYRFKIAWDGKKFLTWTVNDKVFCKHGVRYRKDDLPYTSVFVRLETSRYPAGFDDVTVEGVILKDPAKRLQAPERHQRHRP